MPTEDEIKRNKEAAKYGFNQTQQEISIEQMDQFDQYDEKFQSDWTKADLTYSGNLAAEEYKKMAEYKAGPPAEITKEKNKKKWKKDRLDEIKAIRDKRLAFEAAHGTKAMEVAKAFDLKYEENKVDNDFELTAIMTAYNESKTAISDKSITALAKEAVSEKIQNEEYKKLIEFYEKVEKMSDENTAEAISACENVIAEFYDFTNNYADVLFSTLTSKITTEMCEKPRYAKILLMDSLTTAIYNYADRLVLTGKETDIEDAGTFVVTENINKDALSKLNAHKVLAHKMADAMVSGNGFDETVVLLQSQYSNRKTAALKKEEKKEVVEEKKEVKEENPDQIIDEESLEDFYLRMAKGEFGEKFQVEVDKNKEVKIEEKGNREEWHITDKYVDLAAAKLKEKFGDNKPNENDAARYVVSLNYNFANNFASIKAVAEQVELAHKCGKIIDKISEVVIADENMVKVIFDEDKDNHKELIQKIIIAHKNDFKVYEQISNLIQVSFKAFGDDIVDEILEKDSFNVFNDENVNVTEIQNKLMNARVNGNNNLKVLKDYVKKNVNAYSADEINDTIRKALGIRIFECSPAVVNLVASDVIKRIGLFAEKYDIGRRMKKFEQTCKDVKLPKKYWNVVGELYKDNKDITFVAKGIKEYAAEINNKQKEIDTLVEQSETTKENWKKVNALLKSKSTKIDEIKDKITAILSEEVTGEKINFRNFIEKTGKKVEDPKIPEGKSYYESRLEGKEFKKWSAFNILEPDDVELIYNALLDLLKDKKSAIKYNADFEYLKDIRTVQDLDHISESEFLKLLSFVKDNLLSNLENFANVGGKHAEEVKKALVGKILIEKMPKEQFNEYVSLLNDNFIRGEELGQRRVDLALNSEVKNKTKIDFKFLEVKGQVKYKFKQSKDFKPKTRIDKFDTAKEAWRNMSGIELKKFNAFIYILMYNTERELRAKKESTSTKSILKHVSEKYKVIRDFAKKNVWSAKNKKEKQKAIDLSKQTFKMEIDFDMLAVMHKTFDTIHAKDKDKGRSTYFNEFLLMGYENVLFDHDGNHELAFDDKKYGENSDSENAFLTYENEKYYNFLFEKAKIIHERTYFLNDALDGIKVEYVSEKTGAKTSFPLLEEDKQRCVKQLQKFIGGMKETNLEDNKKQNKENEKYNLNKFGFKNFDEVIEYVKNNSDRLFGMNVVDEEKNRIIKHKDILNRYDEGLFAPVADILMENKEFFQKMIGYDEVRFIEYLDSLKKTMGIPLAVIKSYSGGINTGLNHQFIISHEQMIFTNMADNKVLTTKDWEEKIEQYSDIFFSEKVAGRRSIDSRVKKVNKKHADETWMKLNTVLSREDDLFSILYESKSLKKTLKEVDADIAANTKLYNDTVKKVATDDEKKANMRENFYINHINTMKPEEFAKKLPDLADEFEIMYTEWSKPLVEAKEFDELTIAQNEISAEKFKGAKADKKYVEEVEKLNTAKYQYGSLILDKFGVNKKADYDKAKKKVEKIIKAKEKEAEEKFNYDPYVIEMVIERQMSNKALDDDGYIFMELQILSATYKSILKDKKVPKADKKKALLSVYLKNGTEGLSVMEETPVDVDTFLANNELMSSISFSGYHKDLKYDYEQFKAAAKIAMLSYSKDDFEKFVKERQNYFKNATEVYQATDEWFKTNPKLVSDSEAKRIRIGVMEYMHAKILNFSRVEGSETIDDMKAEIKRMLDDKNTRRFMYDSDSPFGTVSSEDLTEKEKGGIKSTNKFDVENLINSTKKGFVDKILFRSNPTVVKEYANLTKEQRKLFAMYLALPESMIKANKVSSMSVMDEEAVDKKEVDLFAENVGKFIENDDFEPKIDYNKVLYRLQKMDGSLNEEMWNNALKFVNTMTTKQKESIPKDYELLNSSLKSIEAAKAGDSSINERRKYYNEQIISEDLLMNKVNEMAKIDAKISNGLMNKIDNFQHDKNVFLPMLNTMLKPLSIFGYDPQGDFIPNSREEALAKTLEKVKENKTDFNMLILILQDRTAIDYTTSGSILDEKEYKGTEFVNVALREKLKDMLCEADDKNIAQVLDENIKGDAYQKAMSNLYSFQIRDDEMKSGDLTKSNFEWKSSSRNTFIDWNLLQRALEFLAEIKKENNRLKGVRLARENVMNYGNKQSKKFYSGYKLDEEDNKFEFERFEECLSKASTSKSDEGECGAMMAGYRALGEMEKILFIKALQNRDVLDVSRNNVYASFLGQADRDFVNQKGRDELINDFLSKSLGEKTVMSIDKDDYKNAMKSLLSTQIDDTRDFEKLEDIKKLVVGGKFYEVGQGRSTIIDWKLFGRALQFVHRTMEERRMIIGERELYRSQGNLAKDGLFQFDVEFMRKNIHSSGNRLNRVLGRKGVEMLFDQIPGGSYIQMALAPLMSKSLKASLSQYAHFGGDDDEEEETPEYKKTLAWKIEAGIDKTIGIVGSIAGAEQKIQEFTKTDNYDLEKDLEEKIKNKTGKAVNIGSIVENASLIADVQGIIGKTVELVGDTLQYKKDRELLDDLYKKANTYRETDEKRTEKAKANQTELQQQRAEMAIKDNKFLTDEIAMNLTKSTKTSDLVNKFGEYLKEMVGNGIIQEKLLGLDEAAIEEGVADDIAGYIDNAKETILFIMQFVKEKSMVKKYFDGNGPFAEEINHIREGCTEEGNKFTKKQVETVKKMDNAELGQKAHGFEGFDEQSSFIAMRVVHSIISSASHQNTMIESRMKAMAVMFVMGMKEDVGKLDNDTHEKLYNKFMGANYR